MNQSLTIERPKSLVEVVEERLRDAIVNAELKFGEALSEETLGASFGVSRTPLREAFARLELQGLVVVVPKRGTFVFAPTPENVEHLCHFRLMLELDAIKLCLERNREATTQALKSAVAAMEAADADGDRLRYARHDTAFHEAFFACCGNPYLVDAYRTVSGRVAAIRTHLSVPLAKEQERSLKEHRALVRSFAAGDGERIAAVLGPHIARAHIAYLAALKSRARAGTSGALEASL